MQINISLILNVLLLVGVVVTMVRLIRSRRQAKEIVMVQPSLGVAVDNKNYDDIIAVRKITVSDEDEDEDEQPLPDVEKIHVVQNTDEKKTKPGENLFLFLVAKEDRQLAGYELLQTILAAGLRFGEGSFFHRHEQPNGQGPVLCSLAAATPSGTFDLQNIGAFAVRGLCLFMQVSGDSSTDSLRLSSMLKTAQKLSDGLDTRMLDNERCHFTKDSVSRYHHLLNLQEIEA